MYKLVTFESIRIREGRQRTTFDPQTIGELAISIRDNCLMHAPVVEEGGWLVAGERRLRAIESLYDMREQFYYAGEKVPLGLVPVTDVGDLTDIQRYELELEENLRREDISWQDQTAAIARLAQLKTEIVTAETGKPPTARELEQEILGRGGDHASGDLREHLDLAKNLDRPEVAAAKTKKDAVKALKHLARREAHEKLAEAVGQTFTSSTHQLYHADCIQWMTDAEPAQFDVILTDPPYGMGADEFGDAGGQTAAAHTYGDSANHLYALWGQGIARLFSRMTKPNAHLYLFCDLEWFDRWKRELEEAGWQVFRTPLIWFKPSAYRAPWPGFGPQRKWEMILYALKGEKPTTRLGGDVITCAPDANLGHNAQKPVELYHDLLSRSVLPGERVFDPFAGSGPIFPAADRLRVEGVGIERSAQHYGLALARLQALRGIPKGD
jgi:DNA modification methylase/ParB-like chromosome segregation protein Spo0J